MSDLFWAAVVAAVPPTLAVVLARRGQKKDAAKIEEKVDVVHTLANDRLTKTIDEVKTLTSLVATLQSEIRGLRP